MIGERERAELLDVLTSHLLVAHTKSESTEEIVRACQEHTRSLTRREAVEIIAEARAAAAEKRRRAPRATPRKAAVR